MADNTLERVLEGKGSISFRDLEALLKKLGFVLVRVKGSHHIYRHPKVPRHLNIQPVGKDAKPYQIKQLRVMIREFNLSLDERA